ncbi:fluoride efflux transporter FluC [Lacticaseibacillus brantae]|uniref:Fluoride-specific ion channel FluC n=1 Tax=Lacticaseibacillus brantae DSM 23927 TaxID=1423727 RepID=A0A0R2AXI5_9LACO|nr:CrcB family protein [Lacticaseibacillus brantae]KRM71477.1 hypothetical protein FC34_GL001592 [Lacticaseibacillus brantae DSM 23927]
MRYRQFKAPLASLLAVAGFGALGGSLRYAIGLLINGPAATLVVNLVGSFCLALITYWLGPMSDLPDWAITGLGTGLIGAFTTFSTFSLDSLHLLTRSMWLGLAYMMVSLAGGFLLAGLGYLTAQHMKGGHHYD